MKSTISIFAVLAFAIIFTAILGMQAAKWADNYAEQIDSAYSVLQDK
jgi:hypothetical protein